MPGSTPTPFSSPAFRGKSSNGEYGDAVEELDWSTGEVVQALERLGLSKDTMVIWTSDNGAVRRNPPQGSGAPYKGFGYDTSEGAMRMPCVMRWPGKVLAGRECTEIVSTMDLLPTFAVMAGTALPRLPLDGHDVRAILFGEPNAKSPWDAKGLMYYRIDQLQAVRSGPWKLYLPLAQKIVANNGKTAAGKLELYDVVNDVGEEREVSEENSAIVKRLTAMAEAARIELGDFKRPGRGQRKAGFVERPKALVK
jgi:arylsulfatase A-like enzyme